jgi:L-seryl-tRNA(Ser) seleniumtransferase
VRARLAIGALPSLRPVVNATGIILHTNLGRAPLAEAAISAIAIAARGFTNLEYELESGRRGSRHAPCVSLLRRLSGAEDAMVVNNGAAALVLALNTLARRKEVLVSRGELVEIGGSFRIPDIMSRSGVKLVEVGTTNRTHPDDYRRAITPKTAALVKIHRSNFSVAGFVKDVAVRELAFIAAEHGLPVIHDLGSGLLIPLDRYGLSGEPTVREAVNAGPTIALMSGDKLLGGPQAGIILGEGTAIAALRVNPLARALRVDKLTLAALEATLRIYLDEKRALKEIPALAMIAAPVERLRARGEWLRARLAGRVELLDSKASVGAGAFPTATLPSVAIAVAERPSEIEYKLRTAPVPVIGRIEDDRLLLDLRSVREYEDEILDSALQRALA